MNDATPLVRALTDPAACATIGGDAWTALLTMARAERLIGSLACRLAGLPLPAGVESILSDARLDAGHARRRGLWEAEMARRALLPLGCPVVLLKGKKCEIQKFRCFVLVSCDMQGCGVYRNVLERYGKLQ